MTARSLAGVAAFAAALVFGPAAIGDAASGGQISVTVGRASITTKLGHTFTLSSTVTNHGSLPARGLIAHLNVLSLHEGTYVDPEDWSSNRTRYLAPIPAGGSTTTTWKMQAVNSGDFGVYVAVLPQSGAARPPETGPLIHVSIATRTTLNSGGILPLVLGMPALLAFTWLTVRLRRAGSGWASPSSN